MCMCVGSLLVGSYCFWYLWILWRANGCAKFDSLYKLFSFDTISCSDAMFLTLFRLFMFSIFGNFAFGALAAIETGMRVNNSI